MKIGKSKIFSILVFTLVFILYLLLTLVYIKPKENIFYITLSFSIISFLIVNFFIIISFTKEKVLSTYPILIVNAIYFIIQLTIGVVFPLLKLNNTFIWVSEIALMIVFAIILSLLYASKSFYTSQDKNIKSKKDIQFARMDLLTDVNHKYSDEKVNHKIQNLIELINFSDPISNDSILELEEEIDQKINALKEIPDKEIVLKIIHELEFLYNRRNTILKNNK